MENKTLDSLLIEANHNVTRIGFDEALKIINLPNTFIIDVREESEVANLGLIKNAIHIPRGLIEFKIELNSSNNPAGINNNSNLLFIYWPVQVWAGHTRAGGGPARRQRLDLRQRGGGWHTVLLPGRLDTTRA